MNILLFDEPSIRTELLPLTFTRPIAGIRIGIMTIAEKWKIWLGDDTYFLTEDYLTEKFPARTGTDNLFINGALCPDEELVGVIRTLAPETQLTKDGITLAHRTSSKKPEATEETKRVEYSNELLFIDRVWKIFQYNGAQIRADFSVLTKGRNSSGIHDRYTAVYGEENIFVEEGVTIRAAALNAEDGPIYLGRNSTVLEGALVKGPFALCEGSQLSMGSKMRGDTTVGPYSKVGGEVSNSVIFGYSNKAHDGFLGNSVLGEWCNIGADTNTSNLKNNYENVRIWSYAHGGFRDTGLQFCGLIMGDHGKCGINTMFNTATLVGVSANIFGDGFPRTFIPSFSWGGASGFTTFQLQKALDTAHKVMVRRNMTLDEADKKILEKVFELSSVNRIWENK